MYVNFINENSGQGSVALAEGDSESTKKFKFLSFSGSSSFDNTTNEIFDIVLSNPRYSASTFLLGRDIFLQLAQEWSVYDMPGVTKNQESMIKVFNKIYADETAKENMKSVLSTLDAIYSDYRETNNKTAFLNALQDLSGIFYANSFMTSTMFSKANIIAFLKRKHLNMGFNGLVWNDNTITKDIAMLLRMYAYTDTKIYEEQSAILLDLNMIRRIDKEIYEFDYISKVKVHPLIFLYSIRQLSNSQIIDFEDILELSRIFCLSQTELYEIFSQLTAINPNITFDNTAGEQLFSIKQNFKTFEILDKYYKLKNR